MLKRKTNIKVLKRSTSQLECRKTAEQHAHKKSCKKQRLNTTYALCQYNIKKKKGNHKHDIYSIT